MLALAIFVGGMTIAACAFLLGVFYESTRLRDGGEPRR